MKAKIKLELDNVYNILYLKLKMENGIFYRYKYIIVDSQPMYGNMLSNDEFYSSVIKLCSDIGNIKRIGESYLRSIMNCKIELLKEKSKEQEAKELLRKLNKPIEIEVKM